MMYNRGGEQRVLLSKNLNTQFAIIGGGMAGVCAAITAARTGLKVVLIQDRPVLGGNASSEVRLWMLGATSHMGNNNRWAREGGVVDEIMVENTYRNPEGNPLIFDTVLLEKVTAEPNITLLLNTAVHYVDKSSVDEIESVRCFCSQNATEYIIKAPLFCDASGDGIAGFLSGAAFRMGAESKDEFGEKFAPSREYGELLGHSLYFYSKDVGKPVTFVPPSFALTDITTIPRFRNFNTKEYGCKLWWLEYGGRLDTIHDTEEIKWELWKVAYGAWNYIKNSGQFPESANLTLEWVGTIPGKRESRRFEGDYIIKQQDIIEQKLHDDAVAYGGWSIDLHPADGVFSEKPGCNQWHSKGIYHIPYRSLYSNNIKNLFLAGRIISATHVAFGSTRVMATAAHAAQAVGMAAKVCIERNLTPAQLYNEGHIQTLQKELLKTGHHIPNMVIKDAKNLVNKANITTTSELIITELPVSELLKPLDTSIAQMIPLKKGKIDDFVFFINVEETTHIEIELRISSNSNNHTPDIVLEKKSIEVHAGENELSVRFESEMPNEAYAFITFLKNPKIKLHYTGKRITGILSVFNAVNKAVSNYGKQTPPDEIGVDAFEFWCPKRRPDGHNLAFQYANGINAFKAVNITNGIDRPVSQPNAWVADWKDPNPQLIIDWQEKMSIKKIDIFFDTDYDHPMETVLMGHPENVMPFCVRNYIIKDDVGNVVYKKQGNYQTRNSITFEKPLLTTKISIEVEHPSNEIPAAIFSVKCY